MKTLSILLLCLSVFTAKADVLVYKQKINVTSTGGGVIARTITTGYYVMDGQTGDFYVIDVFLPRGRFAVLPPSNGDTVINVFGGLRKEYLVIAFGLGAAGSQTAKGANTSIYVGLPTNYIIPKTLKVSGSFPYITDTDENFIEEYKGTLAFDPFSTIDVNTRQLTLDQTIEEIRTALIGQGLVEE